MAENDVKISEEDVERAAIQWRSDCPPGWADLLDAEEDDEATEEGDAD